MKDQVAKAIGEFLSWNHDQEIVTTVCQCGSINMQTGNGSEINFLQSNAPYINPTLEGVNKNCNRCVNGWAVDKVDHSEMIEELTLELEELEELDQVTESESCRILWIKEEIDRLESEQDES